MSKSREYDKFYTSPQVSKSFVEMINTITPLSQFDKIIEPAAGCGYILNHLPSNAIGMDIMPESDNIIQQDYLTYESNYSPLFDNDRIIVITNPPFGCGYMNPLAVKFFNKSAEFADVIAFIVPAVWHTSWKVQFQLDSNFGLYYSELLPKDSFLLDGKKYDVACCMQLWSRSSIDGYKDIRITNRPPTTHKDFELFLTCDNVSKTQQVREQIKSGEYWDFAIRARGNISICEIKDIKPETTSHFVVKSHQPYVREIMEHLTKNWRQYVSAMGAPNLSGKSNLIRAYQQIKDNGQWCDS